MLVRGVTGVAGAMAIALRRELTGVAGTLELNGWHVARYPIALPLRGSFCHSVGYPSSSVTIVASGVWASIQIIGVFACSGL